MLEHIKADTILEESIESKSGNLPSPTKPDRGLNQANGRNRKDPIEIALSHSLPTSREGRWRSSNAHRSISESVKPKNVGIVTGTLAHLHMSRFSGSFSRIAHNVFQQSSFGTPLRPHRHFKAQLSKQALAKVLQCTKAPDAQRQSLTSSVG